MLRGWHRHPVYRAAAVPERCTCSLSSGQSSGRGYSPLQAASLTFPPETTGRPYEPVQQQRLPASEKVGVLLLNLGGPDTLQDVQPFLYNLFVDDSIIRLPPYGRAYLLCIPFSEGLRFSKLVFRQFVPPLLCKFVCVCAARWLQPVLAQLISTLRAPKSSDGYKKIGGGSPLRRITQEQANALQDALRVRGQDAHVYVGMRYWYPFMEDAVAQVRLAAQPGCRVGHERTSGL